MLSSQRNNGSHSREGGLTTGCSGRRYAPPLIDKTT
jgi:hypothetical protein